MDNYVRFIFYNESSIPFKEFEFIHHNHQMTICIKVFKSNVDQIKKKIINSTKL